MEVYQFSFSLVNKYIRYLYIFRYNSNMQDIELKEILKMPSSTISEWKKAENYRLVIYELLKSMDKDELKAKVEAIKLLKGLK